jgi:hypothetical protein
MTDRCWRISRRPLLVALALEAAIEAENLKGLDHALAWCVLNL